MPYLLKNLKDRSEMYYDCAEKHAALVRALNPPKRVPWWRIWW